MKLGSVESRLRNRDTTTERAGRSGECNLTWPALLELDTQDGILSTKERVLVKPHAVGVLLGRSAFREIGGGTNLKLIDLEGSISILGRVMLNDLARLMYDRVDGGAGLYSSTTAPLITLVAADDVVPVHRYNAEVGVVDARVCVVEVGEVGNGIDCGDFDVVSSASWLLIEIAPTATAVDFGLDGGDAPRRY